MLTVGYTTTFYSSQLSTGKVPPHVLQGVEERYPGMNSVVCCWSSGFCLGCGLSSHSGEVGPAALPGPSRQQTQCAESYTCVHCFLVVSDSDPGTAGGIPCAPLCTLKTLLILEKEEPLLSLFLL